MRFASLWANTTLYLLQISEILSGVRKVFWGYQVLFFATSLII